MGHTLEHFMMPCSSHLCLRAGDGLETSFKNRHNFSRR